MPDSRLNLTIEHRTARVADSGARASAHGLDRLLSDDGHPAGARTGLHRSRRRDVAAASSIINEAAARRYWPNEDPIGQRISIGATDEWREIVGIVGDTRHEGLDADAEPAAYLPQHQRFESLGTGFERAMTLVIRTSGDAASVTPLIRTARRRTSTRRFRSGSSAGWTI